jgi:hypothetical protein
MTIRITDTAKESTLWYSRYIGEEFEVIDTHWDAQKKAIAYRVNTSEIPGRPHAFVLSQHCDQPAVIAYTPSLFSHSSRASALGAKG